MLVVTHQLAVGTFTPCVLLRVCERLGLLRERDLEVRAEPVTSSPAQFRALLAGDLDAALTSPDNVLAYRFLPGNPLKTTGDVRIVAALERGLGLGVYARPAIGSPAGLAGARIGVDVPGSGFAFGLYAVLESLGLKRGRYRVLTLGSTPRRLTSLLNGSCDATMLGAGNELLAENAGLPCLSRLIDVRKPYLGTVLAAMGDRKRDAVVALADALCHATRHVLSGTVDDLAAEEAARLLQLPRALAERYVGRLKDPDQGLIEGGGVDMAAMQTVVTLRSTYAASPEEGAGGLAHVLSSDGLFHPPVMADRMVPRRDHRRDV